MKNEERNMDTMMSKRELKEFCLERNFSLIKDEGRSSIDEIKNFFKISCEIHFRTCKTFSNSYVAWVDAKDNNLAKLTMFRISIRTAKKIVKGREIGEAFDLLSCSFKQSGNTSKNIQYDEYHITAHNEFDAYDAPDDPDPTGELKEDARREMYGGYNDGDWGGLSGEEADLGRWNCD